MTISSPIDTSPIKRDPIKLSLASDKPPFRQYDDTLTCMKSFLLEVALKYLFHRDCIDDSRSSYLNWGLNNKRIEVRWARFMRGSQSFNLVKRP